MKILAIRGMNLASLEGKFSIDLIAPPLGGQGVFALSGPTGAGKSSILDALCLALYASTPRLQRATKSLQVPDPSGLAVSASAATQLLRRGTGSGYAEAEFVGADGVAYRARLTIRRAKGQVSGRFQDPTHELFLRDSAKPCGGNNSETKTAIIEKLGLDFKQFTRAVLLAQNEFAAFLSADVDERATLLERLTGTERFGALSIQTFERAKSERMRLEAIELELAATPVLDDERRATLELLLAEQAKNIDRLEHQVRALDAFLTHQSRLEELNVTALAKERDWLESCRKCDELEPLRVEVKKITWVTAETKELVQTARRTQIEQQRSDTALAHSVHALDAALHAVELARSREAEAEFKLRDVLLLDEQLVPVIHEAILLDQQLTLAQAAQQQQYAAQKDAETRGSDTQRELVAARERNDALHCHIVLEKQWLDERTALAKVVDGWSSKFESLERAKARSFEIAASASKVTALELNQCLHQSDRDKLLGSVETRRQTWEVASGELDALRLSLAGDDLDALEQREQVATGRLERLTALAQLLEQEASRNAELSALELRYVEQANDAKQCLQDHNDRQVALIALRNRVKEMDLELQGAERLASDAVESLRQQLRPNSPCPVCGSMDHPFGGPTSSQMSERLHATLAKLKQEGVGLQADLADAERDFANATMALSRAEGRFSATQQSLADQRKLAHEMRAQLHASAGSVDLGSTAQEALPLFVQGQRAAAESAVELCRSERAKARLRRRQHDEAMANVVRLTAALEEERELLRIVERSKLEAEHALTAARSQLAALEREQQQDLSFLNTDLGAEVWRSKWQQDPAAFVAKLIERIASWRSHSEAMSALERERLELQARLPELERRERESSQLLSAVQGKFQESTSHLTELTNRRQGLLAGRSVAEVEKERRTELEQTRQDLRLANEARHLAEQGAAAAQANRAAQAKTAEAANAAWNVAERAIDAWLEQAEVQSPGLIQGRPELTQLLETGPHRLVDLQRRIAAAQAIAEQALGALEHAKVARDLEAASGESLALRLPLPMTATPNGLPEPPAREQLELARTRAIDERESCRNVRAATLEEQRQDDRNRVLLQDRHREQQQQRESCEHWSQLSQLIGSADGKKLRHLAQEVTLDLVLAHANEHLRDLARRYRLTRLVEGLHIVVEDDELFGAIRSPSSLSGGETFLVSLALALGLASLSAEKVQVETLFIDEGFGSLDSQTLQIAVAALDRVQAGGRQVGIVSHVGDLAERLGVEVRVEPTGGGKSRVRTLSHQFG